MTLYRVYVPYFEGETTYGIYSTKEKAQEICNKINDFNKDDDRWSPPRAHVDEWVLDQEPNDYEIY